MTRRAVAVAVVVGVLGGAAATAAWARSRANSSAADATTSLVEASASDLSQTVATSGTIEPKQQTDLSFTVSGTVTSVAASVGQKVGKGAVLATIDRTTLQSAVDTASAAVTSAEQQLNSVSGSTATQIAAATAQLAQARNGLATAQDNFASGILTSPFSGTVAVVGIAVGDRVGGSPSGGGNNNQPAAANATASTTSAGITVINTDAWVVDASVGSADLAQLKKGLQAEIIPAGATGKVFGTVASVGVVATASSGGSATFPVVVDVTGKPSGLYAGGSATVSIIVKKVSAVLTVPTQAIHTVDGKTVVYQRRQGKQVNVPVTIGTAYGPLTEIKSGLKAGDKVVVTFGGAGNGTRGRGTGGGGSFPGGSFPGGGGFPGSGGFPGGGSVPGPNR